MFKFKRIGTFVLVVAVLGLLGSASVAQLRVPTIDGKIGKFEYRNLYHNNATRMTLYWTIDGDTLYVGLEALAKGWISWGIVTDAGADMILAFVKDGKLNISDTFGRPHQTHRADTDQGGKNDILASVGIESEVETAIGKVTLTVVEFSRKLNTADRTDNVVVEGALRTFLAFSDADDFVTNHGRDRRDAVQINYFNGAINDF
ncbi:hypothetical protein LM602_01370 [Candidatus Acetothermia bacterium]|nr:hypothetical protein [Candidatus Acetothermia bacterium]MCI2431193.1 hypothetical protein [Candidatus Acetothermia bacterium]MCI2437248.1 hypothetical protein [Candidatus Acetothermia bacterium]